MDKIKAWKVNVKDEWYSTVVFAETRGRAKAIAICTDTCDGAEFIEIEVHRLKEADCLYRGNDEIDWYNDTDRKFLVKELGWSCLDIDTSECESCCANEYCGHYQDYIKEWEDADESNL